MKKPNIDRFVSDEQKERIKPENVDFSGVPVIKKPRKKEEKPVKGKEPQAIEQESKHASTQASYHDSIQERIRKIVKSVGKDVVYLRLTEEEKSRLGEVIYAYKKKKIKTSETEIARIALNYLLEEHNEKGKESMLAKVLELLNS
ncbi:MAG TPA: hypothetical protein VMW41_07120 [Candidatus Bathyarchaeia archaeon]|nr:hypothetical protein [Candidatus Bathyarchaeia archaeon]